ncbi:MAG: GlsB/YeaQ/YmgE family stress response membrane protein [Candidatus Angelobacter sp.]
MIASLIWWIIVGLIAGWLLGRILLRPGYGLMADIVWGVVGAIGGGCFARFVVRPYDSYYVAGGVMEVIGPSPKTSILMAALGAVALVWLSRIVSKLQKKQI